MKNKSSKITIIIVMLVLSAITTNVVAQEGISLCIEKEGGKRIKSKLDNEGIYSESYIGYKQVSKKEKVTKDCIEIYISCKGKGKNAAPEAYIADSKETANVPQSVYDSMVLQIKQKIDNGETYGKIIYNEKYACLWINGKRIKDEKNGEYVYYYKMVTTVEPK